MPRFVIVNDAKIVEFAARLAGFRERDGDAAMAREYAQWLYVLPAEEPHTYGSLAAAEESRDDLRRQSRNEEINVYRLITDNDYSEMLAACEVALDALGCDRVRQDRLEAQKIVHAAIVKATGE